MRLQSKTAFLAIVWFATLVGAFLIGGRQPGGHRGEHAGRRSSPSSDLSRMGIEGRAFDGRGQERGSSLAAGESSSIGRGSATGRILQMLSGGAGKDWSRSDFESLAGNLSLEEVQVLVAEISAMDPGPAQRDAYQEVLNRWAELDATSALAHVAGIDAPKFRRDATMNVLRHWSAVDPDTALEFVSGEQGKGLPRGSLAYVFRGIGNSADTSAALDFLSSLNGSGQEKNVSATVAELFERNDKEVIEWANSLPAGDLRNSSIEALAKQWAHYDPGEAKLWLEKNVDESNRPAALAALGDSWASTDPAEAAIWASQLSENGAKNGGKILEKVMKRWIDSDLASAASFLVEQEPSPALDGALERYIQRIKNVDPDATLAWAESISDPARRTNAVRSVAKVLRIQDPAAFTEYVAGSPDFSESERAKILGIEKPKKKVPKPDKTARKKDKQKG